MQSITSKTSIMGIFGYPVEHSLSPVMHNSALKYFGLNYIYLAFLIKPENLKSAVESIRTLNIKGINVTIPHKESVIKYLDQIDTLAEEIGAVNTILNDNGRLVGYNTDAKGFLMSLTEKNIEISNKKILLIGCGGAGKAISIALIRSKVKKIFISDIDKVRAQTLLKKLKSLTAENVIEYTSNVQKVISECDMLINATPIGMNLKNKCIISPEFLHKNLLVYDIVYNTETKLIKYSKKKKLNYITGIDMLLYQGALSFEIWTQKQAPVKIMRNALKMLMRR